MDRYGLFLLNLCQIFGLSCRIRLDDCDIAIDSSGDGPDVASAGAAITCAEADFPALLG